MKPDTIVGLVLLPTPVQESNSSLVHPESFVVSVWQGNYCFNRFDEEGVRTEFVDTLGFSTNNAMLIVQVRSRFPSDRG